MILRNKRAENIFTTFLFILVVFFSTSIYLNYVFTALLARLSVRWTFISIAISLFYNSASRSFFLATLDFFRQVEGIYIGTLVTVIIFIFSTLINVGVWRIIGILVFRKIRKRISIDVLRN